MPQVRPSPATYLIDEKGTAISADHPHSVRRVADCHGASQLPSFVRPSSATRMSSCVPRTLTAKK